MFVSIKHFFGLVMLATVLHSSQATYNKTAFCTMSQPYIELPSTESCSTYYVCGLNGAYREESCGENYSFDKNGQTCAPSDSVNCYYGLENPCINAKSPSHVPRAGCGAWSYCVDQKVIADGNCEKGQVFKDGGCVYGTCSTESQQPGTDSVNVCEIMPYNVYYGDTSDCATYQVCRPGKAQPELGSCENGLVFDLKRGLCNYKESTDCSRVTGEKIPGTGGDGVQACSLANSLKPNDLKCSGYFKCDGQKWVPQSCGSMYWDVLKQTCVQRQRATPTQDCDRCEGGRGKFANAVNENCNEYLICSTNKKVGTGICQSGYFDEAAQACISSGGNLTGYAATNGACFKNPVSCKCNAPDSKTGKCISTGDCKCGLNGVNNKECIECNTTIDPTTGICEDGACSCEQRAVDKCSVADDCKCGLDVNDKSKCITCDPKDLNAQGVCGTATAPKCECDKRAVGECSAQDSCNCGLDVNDKTKCITCDPKELDDQGVCGTATAPICECDKRAVGECSAQDSCNCGLDVNDKTKCITCDPEELDDQGVCGTATTPTCECDKRTVSECSAQDSCNCGLDVNDKTKCITCDPEELDDQGVCGTATTPTCECDKRTEDDCVAKDSCNCGLNVTDNTKCITCEPADACENA